MANRACLWREPVRYQKDLAVETTSHLQSRGGARCGQGSEGQSALRDHQLETESAVDLRAGFVYCQRGDVENRIKELHDGMQIGRTSCSSFLANTFRVLLTAAAYVLMQEMRLHLSPTRHARAQVSTLREHFLKLGAQVIVTVRRIVLHLPQAFPYRESFHRLALSLGAQSG